MGESLPTARTLPRRDRTSMTALGLAAAIAFAPSCAREGPRPAETFTWVAQPIAFEPPPAGWRSEAENSGGLRGVRYVLTGGLGECITVASYRILAERDRRVALERLVERVHSMHRREFLDDLSSARPRADDPVSERDGAASRAINAALDRAMTDYLEGRLGYAEANLREALDAARASRLTLADVLPRIRLQPDRMQEPERWRIGYERDTTIAGQAAFASDDTLIAPERTLLYRQILWVVNGCPFRATYQGTPPNLPVFERLVRSIQFPESVRVAVR